MATFKAAPVHNEEPSGLALWLERLVDSNDPLTLYVFAGLGVLAVVALVAARMMDSGHSRY